jgi:small subunit ribosomal protein S6
VTNWGTFLLPSPITKAETKYFHGHYFLMRFDSDARTQHAMKRTLSLDPRMLRFSIVKMGQKLEDICDIGGKAEWPSANPGRV